MTLEKKVRGAVLSYQLNVQCSMYVKIGFASNIMNEIFERDNQNYNFQRFIDILRNETDSSLGPNILTLYKMVTTMQHH